MWKNYKIALMIVILIVLFILPSIKYINAIQDKASWDCQIIYIDKLIKDKSYNWFLYKFNTWEYHIVNASDLEEINTMNTLHIEQVWKVNWCINKFDNDIINSIYNTSYCSLTYLYRWVFNY